MVFFQGGDWRVTEFPEVAEIVAIESESESETEPDECHRWTRPAVAARVTSELLARRCFVNAMHKRVLVSGPTFSSIAGLSHDLLRAIASCGKAPCALKMEMVCQAWRGVLDDQTLWEELIRDRFPPRALAILRAFPRPPNCYKAFYREQLRLEEPLKPQPKLKPSCALTDFIFTVELVQSIMATSETTANKRILQTWTGPLSEGTEEHRFTVPLNWREWDNAWGYLGHREAGDSAPPPIHLEVIVSRVMQGQLRSKHIHESDDNPDEEDEHDIIICATSLRQERGTLWEDEESSTPDLGVRMKPGSFEQLELYFERYSPTDGEEPMSRDQLLCYLDHDLCW